MAITETYVDPSIAGDSGTGTIGDPYGDVQYALDTMSQDAVNGDRINIKAGTDEILGAALDLSTYGTPTNAAPLMFQGYTSAANDGGIGGISGAGAYSIINGSAVDYTSFVNMHLHNSGGQATVRLRDYSSVIGCEVNNTTTYAIRVNSFCNIIDCYVHDSTGSQAVWTASTSGYIDSCYIVVGNVLALSCTALTSITNNIIKKTDTSEGAISHSGYGSQIVNNTIYSSAACTGAGILCSSGADNFIIANNYIEGFSGVGGIGISIDSGAITPLIRGNRYYNNTSHESFSGSAGSVGDNSAVGSSALTNPGAGDFSVSTDLKAGAYPTAFRGLSLSRFMDIGAVQREEPAGGGGRRPRIRAHGV